MEARETVDGFHLDQDRTVDYEVQAIAGIQGEALVDDGKRDSTRGRQATLGQLVKKALLIGRLQQPRSQSPMDFQPRIDDGPGEGVNGL